MAKERRYRLRWVGGRRGAPADLVVITDTRTGMSRGLTQQQMTRGTPGYDERVREFPEYVHEEFWSIIAEARSRNWKS